MARLVNAYIARLHRAALEDPVVAQRFHTVSNLLAPPSALFRPGVASRVLAGGGRHTVPSSPPAV